MNTQRPTHAPSRRTVLRAGGALGAAGAAGAVFAGVAGAENAPAPGAPQPAAPGEAGGHQVFQHGVASGDPLPNAVLLWTRVTSSPEDAPGAEAGAPVNLAWQVATDEGFANVVAGATVTSDPAADNTVKVDADGLAPDTWYYYRFIVADGPFAGQASTTGRTRTTPDPSASPGHLGIALTSCANWESGYFSAYRDMADNPDIDVVMCVGDYIYEYGVDEYAGKLGPIREHQPAHEIITLADYRLRYGTYRTDKDLQAAHAMKPWMVTWDDHEVANNNWAHGAENHTEGEEGPFDARRDAAMKAYLEWLPVRAATIADGGHLYRHFGFGDLAEIVMLDLRSYRNEELSFTDMRQTDDPSRSILGSDQFNYLAGRWRTSDAKWNIVGNSVMFTPVLIPPMDPEATRAVTQLLGMPEEGMPYNLDQWDGYAAERRRVIQMMGDEGLDNVVFLTGDIHSSWACDVPNAPGRYPADGVAAVEIVCTSVSAPNIDDIVKLPQDNPISHAAETALAAANRHVQWIEFDRHGYVAVHFHPDDIRAEYRLVEDKAVPDQPLHTAATFVARRGEGIRRA
ncbi:alkaline phosphatase D family protein [Corynebacterium sp. 335C]